MGAEQAARARFSRVDAIFQAVCDLPPSEQASMLESLAPDDPAIIQDVMALLRADSDADTKGRLSVDGVRSDIARTIADAGAEPVSIPGFQIVRPLGEGGMGVVYEAEQQVPHRTVALKLLRPGLATPELISRFEFEVEALARLRHPAIAQVYEAGVAHVSGGPRPYFAMELARGEPLDTWIARTRPSLRERLDAFARIADAVQHAHSRGVVHRDLKPANILVASPPEAAAGPPARPHRAPTGPSAAPEIKILDFGVARAIDPGLNQQTLHTSRGQLVGTLPYMSPEQLSGDPNDTDARTDVYTLGVVLYEALTGRRPHNIDNLSTAGAIRAITESIPPRVSTLDTSLRGDIETIVSTAMNPDKSRRYQTAAALADDIRRFLANETIAARPASVAYQLSRLARRHRPAVAALAIVLLAIVVSTFISGVALVKEQRARAEAVALNTSLTHTNERLAAQNANVKAAVSFLRDMLTRANPDAADKDQTTLLQVLDGAAESVRRGEVTSEEVEATLRTTLGVTYGWMGQYVVARDLLEPALEIRERLLGDLDPATIETVIPLARFMAISGEAPAAIELIGDRAERLRPLAADDGDLLHALADLLRVRAIAMKYASREDEIEPALMEAAAIYEKLARDNGALGEVFNELGTLRRRQERFEEADQFYARSLEVYAVAHGDDSERYAAALNNRALNFMSLGRMDEAEVAMRRSLEISSAIYSESTPGRIMSKRANYGSLLISQGKYVEAESVLALAIQEHESVLPAEHPTIAFPLTYMTEVLLELRRYEEALTTAQRAARLLLAAYGPDSPYIGRAKAVEARALEQTGHPDEAVDALLAALHSTLVGYGADSAYLPSLEYEHAALLARIGRPDEGLVVWTGTSNRIDSTNFGGGARASHIATYRHTSHATILNALGDRPGSLRALDLWWDAAHETRPFRFTELSDTAASLRITLLRDAGRTAEADVCAGLLHEAAARSLGQDHPRTLALASDL